MIFRLANLGRLLVVLALVLNGWAPPAHANATQPAEVPAPATAGNILAGSDCHDAAPASGIDQGTALHACCEMDDCTGCTCVMSCTTALLPRPTGNDPAPASACIAGGAPAPRDPPFGTPLRPPIA